MESNSILCTINAVEGFDPTPYAVDYTDLTTNETRKRLPVMAQIAWFRLRYPDGKISVQVNPGKDCFVATAKVYPSYKDPADCFLAEATASRSFLEDKPSVSPREWAQTAAVGIALRNAGFGLQFAMAGDEFPDTVSEGAPMTNAAAPAEPYAVEEPTPPELTPEEKLAQAMKVPCPITKFKGKTLGEVLQLDPGAIKWVAEKFPATEKAGAAAKLIRDFALQQSADTVLADANTRHRTYSALLSMLGLANAHRDNLHKRGLSDRDINQLSYKSMPMVNSSELVQHVLETGACPQGVPGFFRTKAGWWSFVHQWSGILIPVRDMLGWMGFRYGTYVWDPRYKGLDDFIWARLKANLDRNS